MELNHYGLRVWKHKNSKILFAHKFYKWVRRICVIQEDGDNRQIIETHWEENFNWDNWVVVTPEEYAKVKRQYKEIYND